MASSTPEDNDSIVYRQLRIYEFDTETRSWWKRAGFSAT
jgi:hypothetical protein